MATLPRFGLLWLTLAMRVTWPAAMHAQCLYATNNGAISITRYTGTSGAVTITNLVDGLPVTSIGNSAFESLNLTSVVIPDSVTNIGLRAFSDCIRMTSVTIPDSVTSIGKYAFQNCARLLHLTLPPRLSQIEAYSFYGCTQLTNCLVIPGNVSRIGDFAFASCASLTNVTIGSRVTRIGDYAFYVCGNVQGFYFSGNAPDLGDKVFGNDNKAVIYYLPATKGWSTTFGERPTAPWIPQASSNSVSDVPSK